MCTSLLNFILVILVTTFWLAKDLYCEFLLLDFDCDDNVNGFEVTPSGYWIYIGTSNCWITTRRYLDFRTMPFIQDSSVLTKDLKVMLLCFRNIIIII